ncbi:MAG: hypothetical protein O2894_08745 [Planctomycetota bacterium]|nr:hypothetical protein [Planctomycetota bacterium]
MRWSPLLVALAALFLAPLVGAEDEPKSKGLEPDPVGIRWERDFTVGMERAARTGRPMVFCVNALEDERANQQLGLETYRSAAWGEATRGYLAFVCNPGEHGEESCSRYPGHACKAHREALAWFLTRFGSELISPQHVILEPDGDIAFRKEYYTGVVTPALLENYLSNLAPRTAYARAAIGREVAMKALAKMPLEELDAHAKVWLAGQDGLAAAAMLGVFDECRAADRRLALIRALRHTHDLQVPVLRMAAEESILYPEDQPAEALAWIETLFAAERASGVWAATRVLLRAPDEATRTAVLRRWAGVGADAAAPDIGDLPEGERPHAYEALLLAKDRRALTARVPADWTSGREAEVARAQRVSGRTSGSTVDLGSALVSGLPGPLRAALLRAPEETVREHVDAIVAGLGTWRAERVRIAGAIALARARSGPVPLILSIVGSALGDPLESNDTKRALQSVLGDEQPEFDDAPTTWYGALEALLQGEDR